MGTPDSLYRRQSAPLFQRARIGVNGRNVVGLANSNDGCARSLILLLYELLRKVERTIQISKAS